MKQQIFEELEAISEVEEYPDPSRDLDIFAKSSKIKPARKEEAVDFKAQKTTPDPQNHQSY